MSESLFGKDAVLYWSDTPLDGDAATADSAEWDEVDNIADLTDNFSPTDVDITTRATAKSGWEATATVLNAGEINFNMMILHGDEFVDAVFDAFINKTTLTVMDLSGSEETDGAFGLAGNFSVSLTHGKPVKGVQTADVTLKLRSHPEWVIIES